MSQGLSQCNYFYKNLKNTPLKNILILKRGIKLRRRLGLIILIPCRMEKSRFLLSLMNTA